MTPDRGKEPNGREQARGPDGGEIGRRLRVRILPFRGVLRETAHRAYANGPGAGFEEITWIVSDPGRSLRAGPNVTLAPN